METINEILTLEEVADLTKYSLGYLRRTYTSWMDRGVRILKAAPNAKPRFYREDIIKMLEEQK